MSEQRERPARRIRGQRVQDGVHDLVDPLGERLREAVVPARVLHHRGLQRAGDRGRQGVVGGGRAARVREAQQAGGGVGGVVEAPYPLVHGSPSLS